jgi:hypothetical protein
MANQTVSTDANHDALTGRAAGEDFTIQSGATLTLDSMPHLTAMGILGDITITDGTFHIDGSRTFEVTYSGGSGTLPAVGDAISWNGGTDTGKVIRLNSGDNVSGVLTLTKDAGTVTPDDTDAITDGAWAADLDSVKVGFLIVYGEDQDYGATDARATIRITGDWYEIGVGDGTSSQAFTLPHTGHQHGVWVETGSGTGIFEIWHRISSGASTVFYDTFTEFGTHFEGGKVFQQTFGSATLTFGTTTNGGAPPNGARIRIPNVHMGTTTTGAPTTEINSATFASHVAIIPPAVTCNVEIDHLNASSVAVNFSQTNGATLTDSAIGLAGTFIDRCALPVLIDNCCFCHPSVNTTGGIAASMAYTILDMLNGVTIRDSVFYGGIDATAAQALWLQTSQNIAFEGTCKIALSITDENTSYPLRLTTSSNITAETLICLGGGILATAASNNIDIADYRYGYPTGRGTTEQNQNGLNLTGVDNWIVRAGNLVNGGKFPTVGAFALVDSSNVTIRGWGSPSAKISGGSRLTYVASLAGVCSNIKLQRLWFDTLNATEAFLGINSCKGVTVENCSTDYGDEMEADCNEMLVRGVHVASGTVDAVTGFEGDMSNVVGTVFYDHFKSNTTGAVGLLFNDPGTKYDADVEVTAGTPLWNGLADLLLRTSGDQVVYTWPYWILGHTAFQNAAIAVSAVGSYTYEYDLDTGAGFSGSWTTISGANLSAETIDPSGFRIKVRITATATNASAAIKGLAILTNTTLADQAANLYPLDINTLTLTGLEPGSDVVILTAGTESERVNVDANAGSTYEFEYEFVSGSPTDAVDIGVFKTGFVPFYIRNYVLPEGDSSLPIAQIADRNYENP